MATRPVVRESRTGGWDVVVDGHSRAVAHEKTQDAAVNAAKTLFKTSDTVVVKNRVGKIIRSPK
jgi:hypothetical protein